jgi:hypothetical protein
MAEINFGLLDTQLPGRIAAIPLQAQEAGQTNALRAMQMMQGMQQNEVSQMQLQKLRQDAAGVAEFSRRISATGGPSDPMEIAQAFIAHPDPGMKKMGVDLMQKAQAVAAYDKRYPSTPAAAPVAAMPATEGVNTLLGAVGASAAPTDVNQLLKQIQDEIVGLSPFAGPQGDPRANQRLATLNEREKELLKSQNVAPGGTLLRAGLAPYTAPAAKSSFETLLDRSDLTDPEKMVARRALVGKESTTPAPEYIATIDRLGKTTDPVERRQLLARLTYMSTHTPGTTVNVDTKVGNKYGETFAKEIGDADVKLRGAALDAPTMASNANKTLTLLENPKIFTGGAANIKLALARALNVIGDTDTTIISNTEKLIQSTGQATLAAIKTSGLGTGQGFTDKDLKMLQGVAGGTIDLNADTLRAFAIAQHNVATAIVNKWETRRKGIPLAALTGTGIDKETYPIEPRFSRYVEEKTVNGRRLGKKADGTVEEIR